MVSRRLHKYRRLDRWRQHVASSHAVRLIGRYPMALGTPIGLAGAQPSKLKTARSAAALIDRLKYIGED
jgi:hypothetical protein